MRQGAVKRQKDGLARFCVDVRHRLRWLRRFENLFSGAIVDWRSGSHDGPKESSVVGDPTRLL